MGGPDKDRRSVTRLVASSGLSTVTFAAHYATCAPGPVSLAFIISGFCLSRKLSIITMSVPRAPDVVVVDMVSTHKSGLVSTTLNLDWC